MTILRRSAGSPDLSRIPVTHLKPHLLMITWQDSDRTTHVHVYDFESGEAHGVVSSANRSVHRTRGTVRRVDSTVRHGVDARAHSGQRAALRLTLFQVRG